MVSALRAVSPQARVLPRRRLGLRETMPPDQVRREDVLATATALAHWSPSYWNAAVGVLRQLTPHARDLRRRRIGLREAAPPDPAQWAALLAASKSGFTPGRVNPDLHQGE